MSDSVTTPSQGGPGSDGNEGILRIPQSASISEASPLDCLVLYQDTRYRWASYPSAEIQSNGLGMSGIIWCLDVKEGIADIVRLNIHFCIVS